MSYAVLHLPIACDLAQSSFEAATALLRANDDEPGELIIRSLGNTAWAELAERGLLQGLTVSFPMLGPGDGPTYTWALYGRRHVVVSGVPWAAA